MWSGEKIRTTHDIISLLDKPRLPKKIRRIILKELRFRMKCAKQKRRRILRMRERGDDANPLESLNSLYRLDHFIAQVAVILGE